MAAGTLMLSLGLAAGLLLQWLVLVWVRQRGVLANPNSRSSHSQPTPTMGGLSIALVMLGYLAYVAVMEVIPGSDPFAAEMAADKPALAWWWLAGVLMMTLIGLLDDLRELNSGVRFAAQIGAAAMLLLSLHLPLSWGLLLLLGLAMVWFINLYNFMDGIDGIAAAQALLFCLGVQLLASGVPGWSGDLVWLLGGATLAFLLVNWPPAKIFMGDVGSQSIGLLIAGLVLYSWQQNFVPLVGSLILLAGFWFDATYTLCVRMATGQRYTQAHRSHLYQRLARRRGHLWTTVGFLLYGLCWLLPLAYLATRQNASAASAPAIADTGISVFGAEPLAWLWLLPAVLPLAVLCVYFRAGALTDDSEGVS